MKSYFIAIGFMFILIVFSMIGFKYMSLSIKIQNDKDDLWKETLYYGANKAYLRTHGDASDDFTIEKLYYSNKADEVGDDDGYDQIEEELKKDIAYFLPNASKNDYKIAGVKNTTIDECDFDIYISRRENEKSPFGITNPFNGSTDNPYNTVKVSLCQRT